MTQGQRASERASPGTLLNGTRESTLWREWEVAILQNPIQAAPLPLPVGIATCGLSWCLGQESGLPSGNEAGPLCSSRGQWEPQKAIEQRQ